MDNDNVKPIRKGVKVDTGSATEGESPQIQQDIVDELTYLLDMAKKGEIQHLSLLTIDRNNFVDTDTLGDCSDYSRIHTALHFMTTMYFESFVVPTMMGVDFTEIYEE